MGRQLFGFNVSAGSGLLCLYGKGVEAHLAHHGKKSVGACGREVLSQPYAVYEVEF